MRRAIAMLGLVLTLGWTAVGEAQDSKAKKGADERPAADRLRDNPGDTEALNAYINESMLAAVRIMEDDPQGALKKLSAMEAFLDKLRADSPAAKNGIARGKALAAMYQQRIEIQQTPVEELQKKLEADPADRAALNNYLQKTSSEISPLTRDKPDEAAKKLDEAKAFLNKLKENATDNAAKANLRNADQAIASLSRSIEAGAKLVKMIGQPAAPLKIEAWVNGSPLNDEDLKGKVVLLDFWAVWCGPCIATFPHLREWNEHYADKGLVMIGLTRYYNYQWDEDAKKAMRATGKVSHEEEQEMLGKFAASYQLKHRFGLQADDSMSDYYGVTGIPHVVVIDRQGRIRLMKVGSGDENAKAIGDMLAKLLDEKASGE